MARELLTTETRKAEGAFLGAAFDLAKINEPTLTQETLMGEKGLSQGLFGHWIIGRTAIPDKHLIWLGQRLHFSARELRPSLSQYASNNHDFAARFGALTEDQQEVLLKTLEALEAMRRS